MKNIDDLVRHNIKKLNPYQSARRIGGHGDVWLNANEFPVPMCFSMDIESFNRYPECQPKKLISYYSNYVGLSTKEVLATRGADEGIDLLIKAFCEPGEDAIICCPPTYDMYYISAQIANVFVKSCSTVKNSWQINTLSIKNNLDKVKLIYICNPNNPTGTIIIQDDIINLLEITKGKALIVVDEAYIDFCLENSMVSYLQNYNNLVILRTLSKAFSLAGIRCGFVLAQEEVINILDKVISPYPISTPSAEIAVKALEKKSIQLMKKRILDIHNNRIFLISELSNLSCVDKIFSSSTNYILVRFFMCEVIFNTLWNNGIIVRMQNKKIYLDNCIRISVGTYDECVRLIHDLKMISKK